MTRSARGALLAAAVAVATILAALWFLRAEDARGAVDLVGAAGARPATASALEAAIDPRHEPAAPAAARVEATASDAAMPSATGPTLVLARVTAAETGLPIAHVFVTAWRENGTVLATPQEIETDESGLAEIEVEPRVPLVVSAQGDGRNTANANVSIPPLEPGERREVALAVLTREDLVVHGVVLRRDTREPIANVSVESVPTKRRGTSLRATTGNDGRFQIAVRSFATASLRYEHAEFGTALSPARAGHEDASRALEILLEPCASIRVTVIAVDGSDTTNWAAVATTPPWSIEQPNGSWVSRPIEVQWLGFVQGGAAVVAHLPAHAPLDIELRSGSRPVWHAREPIVLVPGEVREIACRTGEASIFGIVREADGSPAAGVEMRVGASTADSVSYVGANSRAGTALTTTDANGAYRFEGLEPGAWRVGPAPAKREDVDPRRDPAPVAQQVVLEPGGAGVRHDVTLVRGLVVAGSVVSADGKPAAGARVSATNNQGFTYAEAFADEGGSFTVGPLCAGTWRVHAIANGASPSEPIEVAAGAEDVVLRLSGEARFAVRVRDEAGNPLVAAMVSMGASNGQGLYTSMPTDAAGLADFGNLVADTYKIAVTTDDGRYAAQRDVLLAEGSSVEVPIVAAPGGRARLRFDGPGETALAIVIADRMLVRVFLLTRGAAVNIAGPLGEVEVQLQIGEKRHDRKVVLAREAGPEIVFDGGWK